MRIPWLDAVCGLRDSKILEIGCGTGASTLALVEQGAAVTAVDVDGASLRVAKDRLRLYGCEASFLEANAKDVPRLLAGQAFDLVVFFGTLEHLTHDERLAAMRGTWGMIQHGGYWAVVETPNRLWYFDTTRRTCRSITGYRTIWRSNTRASARELRSMRLSPESVETGHSAFFGMAEASATTSSTSR